MTDVVTIGDIVLRATSTDDSGAWNAPEKRTEQGFPYSSYAGSEPIEGSIEAWVPKTEYPPLQSLRESGEPFAASIGHVSLEQAKLETLDIQHEGRMMWSGETYVPAYQVSITITQIRESEIETAEISIETEAGSMGSAASESNRSYAQPEDEDGGDTEGALGSVASTLSGVRESLSGVF